MIGFRTIRDGERVAVWSDNGTVKTVGGPRRIWLGWGQAMQRLGVAGAAAW